MVPRVSVGITAPIYRGLRRFGQFSVIVGIVGITAPIYRGLRLLVENHKAALNVGITAPIYRGLRRGRFFILAMRLVGITATIYRGLRPWANVQVQPKRRRNHCPDL